MPVKKIVLFVVGFLLVILGIAWTIRAWEFVQYLFWGIGGPLLAVGGMILLTLTRD